MKQIFRLSLPIATIGCLIPLSAQAQITPDGTTSTTVNGDGNNFTIEQGDRAGNNLFHSFDEFSVPTLGSAVFNNAGDIANIFSRVTGSSISNIDGLLGANGAANLYLINPNGIIFGENASLNLGGSFFASTADSLLFEGDTEFSASNPQTAPLLEVNIPTGLSFRDIPGNITVQGDGNNNTQDALEVSSNNTISILGGNLIFENASLGTRGGRIEIGSIAGEKIDLIKVSNGFTFDYSEVTNFRDISFLGNSVIDASGNVGGNIQVTGKNIFINDVSSIQANTLGNGIGNNINIFALDSIVINGIENENNSLSGVYSRVLSDATGTGGNINIEANNLSLENYSILTTDTLGEGNSGNININIINSLNLEIILESPTNISEIRSIVTDNGSKSKV